MCIPCQRALNPSEVPASGSFSFLRTHLALPVCLMVGLTFDRLPNYLSVCLSVCLTVCLPFDRLPNYLSVDLSVFLSTL